MLNLLRHVATKSFIPLTVSVALILSTANAVNAQVNDSEAPVLIHRQIDSGVAGELQTFLARVSDDFGVENVVLYYRQSDTGQFQSIPMRPLLDSIGEYMIAIETSVSDYQGLQYYIEAVDAAGNTTNRGFSYAPIVLPLTEPATVAGTSTPGPIVPPTPESPATEPAEGGFSFNPTLVLVGLGALLALGALAGGSDGGEEPAPIDPGTTPTDTVTLTIVTDQPTAPGSN